MREGGGGTMPRGTPGAETQLYGGEGLQNLLEALHLLGFRHTPFWGETTVILYGGWAAKPTTRKSRQAAFMGAFFR